MGGLIQVPVHAGMSILAFKSQCIALDLWHGSPICECTPLSINFDIASMMSDGTARQVVSAISSDILQTDCRYNRIRLCTCDGNFLQEGRQLEEGMLTDTKLFKVVYMKQFNYRTEEAGMIDIFQSGRAEKLQLKVHSRTPFIVMP